MKTFIAALIIFALLFLGVFWNAYYITTTLETLHEKLLAIPYPAKDAKDLDVQYEALSSLRASWQKCATPISMSVNHADLMEAETHFAAAYAAANAGDRANYLVARGELSYALRHLGEMSRLSIKSFL